MYFARLAWRDLQHVVGIARMLVHAVDDRSCCQDIVKRNANLGALRNSNQRPGHLWRLAFLSESFNLHAGAVVRFRIPVARGEFQMQGQNSILQLTGGSAILVGVNGNGRW